MVATVPDPEDQRLFARHLLGYRDAVMAEMESTIRRRRFHRALGRRLADYPIREGKGIRPALCLATCQALGGTLAEAMPSAVALELFHNAFLVHDDIEDESLHRRGSPTMHEKFGTAIAINVGDALNVLSMTPLLDNTRVIGLEKALRVFHEIELMARASVEGQAMELEWVRSSAWELTDRHYNVMTSKKTCWYTCITPCRIGALIAVGARADLETFRRFGYHLGVAFQIQDDVLNLVAPDARYGKEALGDIWEGKRTLMLLRLVRVAAPRERERVVRIMRKPRSRKSQGEVDRVFGLMKKYDCIGYAREASRASARRAERVFDTVFRDVPDSRHKAFLREAVDFVIHREL
jgi:geranylgeranyl diphosphate synthase type II